MGKNLKMCIDVGGTKIAYGILNGDNEILFRHQTKTPIDITPDEFTQKMYKEIDEALALAGMKEEDLVGIALGMPSYVDFERGYVISSGSIEKIKNYPVREELQKKYSVPILVDNDTNVAALAEHKYGAGRGFKHIIYMALSTGTGTGFIINGDLFRGTYGGAGESGHMIVTPGQGIIDGCGNPGCIMSYSSGCQVTRHAKIMIEAGYKTMLADMVDDLDDLTAKDIAEAYQKGDEVATKIFDMMCKYAAIHIYNLFISININCFVCGGGLTNMGDFYLDRIREEVDKLNHQDNQEIIIKKAELDGDFGLIGSGILIDQLLGGEN